MRIFVLAGAAIAALGAPASSLAACVGNDVLSACPQPRGNAYLSSQSRLGPDLDRRVVIPGPEVEPSAEAPPPPRPRVPAPFRKRGILVDRSQPMLPCVGLLCGPNAR